MVQVFMGLKQPLLAAAVDVALDAQAGDERQVVDVELSVQMVDFVLEAAGQEPFAFDDDGQAVLVQGPDAHLGRALDLGPEPRDGKGNPPLR